MSELQVDAESPLLETVLYSSRAMRRLNPKPVPEPLLLKLIDAANQAPSGSNAQQTRWIVVRDPDQKQKLADLNRLHGAPYIQPEVDQPKDAKHKRLVDAVVWQMEHMHEIPALIVACYDYDEPVSGGRYLSQGGICLARDSESIAHGARFGARCCPHHLSPPRPSDGP